MQSTQRPATPPPADLYRNFPEAPAPNGDQPPLPPWPGSPPDGGAGSGQPGEGGYVPPAGSGYGDGQERASPLVLDLDGDGLELLSIEASNAFFDLDDDGFAEKVGWVAPDDALLAFDRNGDGVITGRAELFGGTPSDGFAALRLLDTNGDGRISQRDADFANLRVWRDLNGDGWSQAGELQSLAAAGITSISLNSSQTSQTIAGNAVTDLSTFRRADGTTGTIADVWFTLSQRFAFAQPGSDLPDVLLTAARGLPVDWDALFTDGDIAAFSLPMLRGYGTIPSLTMAMWRDPTLLALVETLVATPPAGITDGQVRAILHRWAGVDGVVPGSRGVYADARDLAFLERFFDDPFEQAGVGTNPGSAAAVDISGAFATLFAAMQARLLAQGPFAEIFGPDAFDYLADTLRAENLAATLDRAVTAAAAQPGSVARIAWWQAINPVFTAIRADAADPTAARAALDAAIASSTGFALGSADFPATPHIGTAGNDTLTGSSGCDLLLGAAGDDTLRGGAGDDLYLFGRGDGRDWIDDANASLADALLLGTRIAPRDLVLSRAGITSDDLVIAIDGTADTITIRNHFSAGAAGGMWQLETIRFAGGIIWTYADILARLTAATAGHDRLIGDAAANTLGGGAGHDTLEGRDGDDTYLFARGDGHDRIEDAAFSANDALVFAAGIAPRDLILSRAGITSNDLVIAIAGTTDTITIEDQFFRGAEGGYLQIETIRFASGVVWTYADIFSRITAGTAGNDTLIGDAAANTLEGGAGADTLSGRSGADTFLIRAAAHSAPGAPDVITDFSVADGDILDFSLVDADTSQAGNQAFRWLGVGADFSGAAGELRGVLAGNDLAIHGDLDGDGLADLAVLLRQTASLNTTAVLL